ncbi:hypothetical protein C8R45DRAFT_1039256 [Mycena sanguinolenta]|nr:hypothetical protein C8R45DRAFT_1039256 [Mycena sanguinolenta]
MQLRACLSTALPAIMFLLQSLRAGAVDPLVFNPVTLPSRRLWHEVRNSSFNQRHLSYLGGGFPSWDCSEGGGQRPQY